MEQRMPTIGSGLSLGLVASGKRKIKPGTQYNKFFDTSKVKGKETELTSSGTVYDTIALMQKIVRENLWQTEAIAKQLKGSSVKATCENIWWFLFSHVQYKKDNPLREQLRTPLRTWKDRGTGVDCDCFSIFISSILTNLSIPHAFRMAGYQGDFQHVYVIVPKSGKTAGARSSYYVIDPVVDKFDYETPFTKKHDTMPKVTMLNGPDDTCEKPVINRLRKFVDTQVIIEQGKVPTRDFLVKNKIPFTPVFNTDTEQSGYLISTNAGEKTVPTVLTKDQAAAILSSPLPSATTPPADSNLQTVTASTANLKKIPWWVILLGAAGLYIAFGDSPGTPKQVNGVGKAILYGPGIKKGKSKKSRKKIKTLTI